MGPVAVAVLVLLIALAFALLTIRRSLIIVPPNQLAVISGRQTPSPGGGMRGYRLVRGGRIPSLAARGGA